AGARPSHLKGTVSDPPGRFVKNGNEKLHSDQVIAAPTRSTSFPRVTSNPAWPHRSNPVIRRILDFAQTIRAQTIRARDPSHPSYPGTVVTRERWRPWLQSTPWRA